MFTVFKIFNTFFVRYFIINCRFLDEWLFGCWLFPFRTYIFHWRFSMSDFWTLLFPFPVFHVRYLDLFFRFRFPTYSISGSTYSVSGFPFSVCGLPFFLRLFSIFVQMSFPAHFSSRLSRCFWPKIFHNYHYNSPYNIMIIYGVFHKYSPYYSAAFLSIGESNMASSH